MTKLTEIKYVRPDLDKFKAAYQKGIEELKNAGGFAGAKLAVEKLNEELINLGSYVMLASLRHTIDTRDEFYDAEDKYWTENYPYVSELETEFAKTLLASPFKDDLIADGTVPKTYTMMAQNQVKTFDPSLISEFQTEGALVSRYNNLIASAEIEFEGETLNLSQLGKYTNSTDDEIRKAAFEASTAWFVEHEAEFDDIYDQMVKVRTKIAHELGFKDYAEMSFATMNRFGYDQEMVNNYRDAVKKYVTPFVTRYYEKVAKRFGKDHLNYYDLSLEFPSGNATPKGTPEELVEKAHTMYKEMSPETGKFFDFMVENDTLDLVAKAGKQSGGYCEFIPKWKMPIIFANFNGTSGDVDVLTHEAGHAFQTFESQWIKMYNMQFPTFEAAEIFSMSMEFMAYPWMNLFFEEQTAKYKYSHLAGTLNFLPYGVLVDHYQYEVYSHPEMTPDERKATWRKLEKEYLPYKDYSESKDLDRGIYWMRQGHIFSSPFYYIDYTIAQVVAQQFWLRREVQHDETAWTDYLTMAKAGGSKTLMELIELGHMKSPFEGNTLEEIVTEIEKELDAVDEEDLK